MRSRGQDIVELFGYAPDDRSDAAMTHWRAKTCPFSSGTCSKRAGHTGSGESVLIYGTCSVSRSSVTANSASDMIACPRRMYANAYQCLRDVVDNTWGSDCGPLICGGSRSELLGMAKSNPVSFVAFGQGSGNEISVDSFGKLVMDWIIQRYEFDGRELRPTGFVGVEVQTIDITGNYRDNFHAYTQLRAGNPITSIPNSGHGLNGANVHKRLIPQIIRKGNVYKLAKSCLGFYFVVPDPVFVLFEKVLGAIEIERDVCRDNVTVMTYHLGNPSPHGQIRDLVRARTVSYKTSDIAMRFATNADPDAANSLENTLRLYLSER